MPAPLYPFLRPHILPAPARTHTARSRTLPTHKLPARTLPTHKLPACTLPARTLVPRHAARRELESLVDESRRGQTEALGEIKELRQQLTRRTVQIDTEERKSAMHEDKAKQMQLRLEAAERDAATLREELASAGTSGREYIGLLRQREQKLREVEAALDEREREVEHVGRQLATANATAAAREEEKKRVEAQLKEAVALAREKER